MRRAAGFSLVELLVAMVVSGIVVAGALALLTTQQRVFQRSSGERAIQEAGRVALEEITSNLRLAGFGLEPPYALDFGPIAAVVQDRLPEGAVAAVPGYQCATPVTCRDAIDAPDEIVFHYRDPSFVRALAAVPAGGGSSLTIQGPLPAPIRRGQILQVTCTTGNMYWAFVTVASDVPATTAPSAVVPLLSGSNYDFGRQNQVLADGCFGNVAPPGSSAVTVANAVKVLKVDRFRYFVRSYDAAGNVVGWGSTVSRPYLMLDQGLFDENGVAIEQVIAPDVEDLQLAYVFPRSPAGKQAVGDVIAIPASADGIDLAAQQPLYADPGTAAVRQSHHPANVGAVRVAIVVRMPEPDANLAGADERTVPASLNRPALAAPAGYRRTRFETTAVTPNLDTRAPFFPSYSISNGTDLLNVGGG